MTPVQFLFRFVIIAFALAALCGAFNAVVDPYLAFDSPRISGFNARKPAVATREKLMKSYDAVRRPAKTLILGSSRSDIGLNPSSNSWRTEDQPVYNLSLAGGGLQVLVQYLQHFIASRPAQEQPSTLVIGLDFESSLYRPRSDGVSRTDSQEEEANSLLVLADGSKNPHRLMQITKDYIVSTLSADALIDSVSTIVASAGGAGANVDERGRLEEVAFREAVESNGVAGLFFQKNKDTVRQYGEPHQILSESPDEPVQDLGDLKQLIDIGQGIKAEVVLFIHPAHADRMELFDRMGYWEDYERWKREVAALVDSEREEGARVELWDFGGYESYVQEVVPGANENNIRFEWFWEPAHYTSTLGDVLIERMRSAPSSSGFGVRLTGSNLAERLRQIRADRDQYRRDNPAELKRIESLLCSAYPCN